MTPEVWGRYLWFSIHYIAMDYPMKPSARDREYYKEFFENLWKVIPCFKCAQHYQQHLKEFPLVSEKADFLANRDTLFAWTVELHNIVNKELGKPQMSVESARKLYSGKGGGSVAKDTGIASGAAGPWLISGALGFGAGVAMAWALRKWHVKK